MMRTMGVLMMALSVTCFGFLLAEQYRKRQDLLCFLRKMILFLKNAVLKGNETLGAALALVGERFLGEAEKEMQCIPMFFLAAAERLSDEDGRMFQEIWEEELEKHAGSSVMREEDRGILLQLGRQLGYADREMQEKTFDLCLDQLEEAIRLGKEEKRTKMRLFRLLGMAAGSFLVILMI